MPYFQGMWQQQITNNVLRHTHPTPEGMPGHMVHQGMKVWLGTVGPKHSAVKRAKWSSKQGRILFNKKRQVLPRRRWPGRTWSRKKLWLLVWKGAARHCPRSTHCTCSTQLCSANSCFPKLPVSPRQAPQQFFKACHLHLSMAWCISPQAQQHWLGKQQHKTFSLLSAELATPTFSSLLFSPHPINAPALPEKAHLSPLATFKPCLIRMPYTCSHLPCSPPSQTLEGSILLLRGFAGNTHISPIYSSGSPWLHDSDLWFSG